MTSNDWRIDTSAGREILVYKDCSVIEEQDARYVLGLIHADISKNLSAETFHCERASCMSLGEHHPLCAGVKLLKENIQ